MKKLFHIIKTLFSNPQMARFALLKFFAKYIFPSYRFKWPQLDWWENIDFTNYLKRFQEESGMNTDRRWMLSQLHRLTAAIPGDTAECGVYRGAASYLICHQNSILSGVKRRHFMFDSFQGISKPLEIDGNHWKKGDLSASIDEVEDIISEFPDAMLMKGWIPSRFYEVFDRQFSFVHIDVDLYEPTRESIEFFYPRMAIGGIILCDDYGFTTCPGATRAVNDFLGDKPEKMISLCSGGGFMIKGCTTINSE